MASFPTLHHALNVCESAGDDCWPEPYHFQRHCLRLADELKKKKINACGRKSRKKFTKAKTSVLFQLPGIVSKRKIKL